MFVVPKICECALVPVGRFDTCHKLTPIRRGQINVAVQPAGTGIKDTHDEMTSRIKSFRRFYLFCKALPVNVVFVAS